MIRPVALYNKARFTRDTASLGRVVAVLCNNRHVSRDSLTDAELSALEELENESEEMDKAMRAEAERKAEYRRTRKTVVSEMSADKLGQPVPSEMSQGQIGRSVASAPNKLTNKLTNKEKGEKESDADCAAERRAPPMGEDEMKLFAGHVNVPEDYLRQFIDAMNLQEWAYINRNGKTVPVNRSNFKTVLGTFYRTWKEKRDGTNVGKRTDRNDPYHERGLADDIGV